MSVVTTLKYRSHNAKQFVESLTEGFRTYGANTISANANSTVLSISGNVFSTMRVGDILLVNSESRLITNIESNGTSVTINSTFSTAISSQLFKTREPLASFDTYYFLLGRSTPWPSGDTDISDTVDSEESTNDYLDDALSIRRITEEDLIFVVPKVDWTNNSKYSMFDHRANIAALIANTTHPLYVRNSTNDVFKCLYNGRTTSNDATIANSTSEPSISGVASPSDIITSSAENNRYYLWKYLYTISSEDEEKFVTGNYMPVRDASDTLDTSTGDVFNDSSARYITFNTARTTGNGGIYQIVVDAAGNNYSSAAPPSVVIDGDGSGAVATVEISGNNIIDIHMITYGENYSFADVRIVTGTGVSGSGATASAIISPRNSFANDSGLHYFSNHAINNKNELYAKHVMLYVELEGSEGGFITTANEYRRIAILKNPLLVNGEVATANLYDMTTTLTITTGETFNKDEIVYQASTGAYGVVVEQSAGTLKLVHVSRAAFTANDAVDRTIIGIGNGNTTAVEAASQNVVPSALPESFEDIVAASGATGVVTAVLSPDIIPRTGEILFVQHLSPIFRANTQTEVIRTVLTF